MNNVTKHYYQTPILEWKTFGEDVITTSEETSAAGEEAFDKCWID